MARELAMTDDCYRALILGVSGGRTDSSGVLTPGERQAVIGRLRDLGAGRRGKQRRQDGAAATNGRTTQTMPPRADSPEALKARALWLALWHLGELADGSEVALAAFAERQTGVAALQWVRGEDASRVIDALKAMCGRAGYQAPATDGKLRPGMVAVIMAAKRDLVRQVWARLAAIGVIQILDPAALNVWVSNRIAGHRTNVDMLSGQDLDRAAAKLGEWLRRVMRQRGIEPPLSVWLRKHRAIDGGAE